MIRGRGTLFILSEPSKVDRKPATENGSGGRKVNTRARFHEQILDKGFSSINGRM